jgi:hypothetical protein
MNNFLFVIVVCNLSVAVASLSSSRMISARIKNSGESAKIIYSSNICNPHRGLDSSKVYDTVSQLVSVHRSPDWFILVASLIPLTITAASWENGIIFRPS